MNGTRSMDRGPRPTGQHQTRAFLIYRARIKKIFFDENARNRCNRVTLGKKLFVYIDLEDTQTEKRKCNETRVCVTSKGQECVKGVAENFLKNIFLALYKQRG